MTPITDALVAGLPVIVQILNAANAITAFSLLFYALTFNVRERTARILALLLACVALVYATDVLAGTAVAGSEKLLWLKVQWIGISLIPAAYMHLSDALLAATGRPSRGRRNWVIRVGYLFSAATLLMATFTDAIVGELASVGPIGYLTAGPLFPVFMLFYAVSLAFTGVNLWRAYQRCLTKVSRRRMRYLMFGVLAPFLGTFPFLTLGLLPRIPLAAWTLLIVVNLAVAAQIVLMSYSVAYFGVSYPDRVVKARLFQWILRGPVVASTTLAITVLVNRLGETIGIENSRAVPLMMVSTILALQFLITLIRPTIERWLFYGQDRYDVQRLHLLEERLLTTGDLRQYLESILNAACDLSGAPAGFVAVVEDGGVELEVAVGLEDSLQASDDLPPVLLTEDQYEVMHLGTVFLWNRYWLTPLQSPDETKVAGIMGLQMEADPRSLEHETLEGLGLLKERATVALTDRALQREVFSAVDRLVPLVEEIQRMRSAARYGNVEALSAPLDEITADAGLTDLVREALSHYWGGPRLTESPLLGLRVVREAIDDHDGNAVNALRSILLTAIEQVRPQGERRFTAEWMLYNILELKFLQGRKVREVAMRLAMSEADLYRKQKVAIDSVAKAMAKMERAATKAKT